MVKNGLEYKLKMWDQPLVHSPKYLASIEKGFFFVKTQEQAYECIFKIDFNQLWPSSRKNFGLQGAEMVNMINDGIMKR